MDAFGGVGGNSVQLATTCKMTVVTDISMARLLLAKHNAQVYGVANKLDFVCGDFLKMAPHFQVGSQALSLPSAAMPSGNALDESAAKNFKGLK